MNILSDMICIDVIRTSCCITAHRYWVHRKQVWVSGYKHYWNHQMTPILMNTLSDMICIYAITTSYCILAHWCLVHSKQVWVSGYIINGIEMIKWRLYLWIHYQIWSASTQSQLYVALPPIGIGSTGSRYRFQDVNRIVMINWRLYLWIHCQIWSASTYGNLMLHCRS